jgi:3'-phosphoadenosine 5'-phosphosulfate sulfotransferase (PAPS reductase)/FAD synthetase
MEHILSLSYGKDSLACLGAVEELGLPLDRIVHAEVWATETTPADLPPMVEFKKKADAIIKERWGIEVEHYRAECTYEDVFYREYQSTRRKEYPIRGIYGFPYQKGPWCNSRLKLAAIRKAKNASAGSVQFIGIAADEEERIERHKNKPGIRLPLVEIGWAEKDCFSWCEQNDLLSPTYKTSARGGCWFCHNQGVDQLRLLRRDCPDLWKILLGWDTDSPVPFKADGHTVHDFDRRFQMEDDRKIPMDSTFRWEMLNKPPKFVAMTGKQLSMWGDV